MGLRGRGRGAGGADRARVGTCLRRGDGGGRGLHRQCTKCTTFGGDFVVLEGAAHEADGGVQPNLSRLVLRGQAGDGSQPCTRVEEAEDARAWLRRKGASLDVYPACCLYLSRFVGFYGILCALLCPVFLPPLIFFCAPLRHVVKRVAFLHPPPTPRGTAPGDLVVGLAFYP